MNRNDLLPPGKFNERVLEQFIRRLEQPVEAAAIRRAFARSRREGAGK